MTATNIPLVSIAVLIHNGQMFLAEQLVSMFNQWYSNLEIIAEDDNYIEGTLQNLKGYEEKYSNIEVYQNKQNSGYPKNFEKAISLCNSNYVALSEQDDIWELCSVYANKLNKIFTLDLVLFFIEFYHIIFGVCKKVGLSKLDKIYKRCTGIKSKNLTF
jgi:glycosyltransferase involved in cell wall biosynthesis